MVLYVLDGFKYICVATPKSKGQSFSLYLAAHCCVFFTVFRHTHVHIIYPIGSMYGIYGNIYHQYTPNVSIYTIHGSYGYTYIYIYMFHPHCWLLNHVKSTKFGSFYLHLEPFLRWLSAISGELVKSLKSWYVWFQDVSGIYTSCYPLVNIPKTMEWSH